MVRPPFDTGADQLTMAEPSAGAAVTPVGASGAVAGITDADDVEAGPVPVEFVAVTLNV